ncbi:MAG: hypothetical protein AUJ92_12920 [Armatimonadetes bacterium CG2_30_59_28]|nr:hypothetical protein [Armatimonadota bacterium]OIO93165.1 MAG: hypothetical protein AUJ92_12920 [Armatimonadetes bacterium CG2_30_59_28]PIU62254.1 MAG: hypothetical protein COS85_18990 [Armatimonadetes bacterium CG07_land_8_20_14_0_80_59_28]PIX37950.1 MAG: hypothetical protein COZ56_21770 [Armatimonadetes bacterium CG_4_8_14_3_um_filter_58_9]PIY48059.1 MAG: hypothetical protein COZ05_04215 [Armatimonadetes bacterium CG_4_10_14_3_um_filter_59_10]
MNARIYSTLMLALFLTSAAFSKEDWREPGCERRVALTLPAADRVGLQAGIVFTGADFYRWTGVPRPPVASLALHTSTAPVSFQMEERDESGHFQPKGNGVLDDDDRVAFTVALSPKLQPLLIYYDGVPQSVASGKSSIEVVPQQGKLYSLLIKNGSLTIGLHGGGVEPTSANRIENHGRGSLAFVEWQGVTMARLESNWGNYFPRTLASGPGAPVWSEPEVVYRGPARTVVEMRCDAFKLEKDGKETFSGDVVHYLYFWENCAVVDLEEIVNYTSTDLEGSWPYASQVQIGKDLDEADQLIVPLADTAHVVTVNETPEHRLLHPWRQLYATDNPEEGWYAWKDPNEKTGLATFYEKMDTVRFRQSWVTYRPALHPSVHIRTTPYTAPQEDLHFKDRARRCRSRYERDVRYTFLKDETPKDIRLLYHAWGKPVDEFAATGWPEMK